MNYARADRGELCSKLSQSLTVRLFSVTFCWLKYLRLRLPLVLAWYSLVVRQCEEGEEQRVGEGGLVRQVGEEEEEHWTQ